MNKYSLRIFTIIITSAFITRIQSDDTMIHGRGYGDPYMVTWQRAIKAEPTEEGVVAKKTTEPLRQPLPKPLIKPLSAYDMSSTTTAKPVIMPEDHINYIMPEQTYYKEQGVLGIVPPTAPIKTHQ